MKYRRLEVARLLREITSAEKYNSLAQSTPMPLESSTAEINISGKKASSHQQH